MPPQSKRIFTLRDVSNEDGHNNAEPKPEFPPRAAKKRPAPASSSSSYSSINNNPLSTPYCQPAAASGTSFSWTLHHIETLPNAELCRQTLERIQAEFGAIIQKRGYNVVSISEMCCCGDGLSKTRKVQPSNVWGYNLTTRRGRYKSHEIHLRLRNPKHHALLLDYEDVAGTMAHELAHCVHGNHGKQFQQLMNELLDDHASYMASQLSHSAIYGKGSSVPGSGGIQMPTTGGQTLGGTATKSRLLETAATGSKLGGTKKSSLSPREAALRAAETRRKIQDRVKQRAMEQCLIDLTLEDDDDDDDDEDRKVAAVPTKKSTRTKSGQRSNGMVVKSEQVIEIIDLEDDHRKPKAKSKNTPTTTTSTTEVVDLSDVASPDVHSNKKQQWACTACTFLNAPTAMICGMCDKSRR